MPKNNNLKKIAFFVEGQTEQIFLNRLIREILGQQNVSVILKRSRGGSNVPKQDVIWDRSLARSPKYLILICDCGADNRVKSEILDNAESLKSAGYEHIIGMRDLYPLPPEDFVKLENGLNFLPKRLQDIHGSLSFLVVVQEVETWFLGEYKHLAKVDKKLTGKFIKHKLGFDPYIENAMARKHPATDLNNIYKLVGRTYSKKYWQVKRLVNKLDYNNIRHNIRYEIPTLDNLLKIIESIK